MKSTFPLTDFQQEFDINNEFYSGEQVREMIHKHFPLVDKSDPLVRGGRVHQGLLKIITPNQEHRDATDVMFELSESMPDITSSTSFRESPYNCYCVVEGEGKHVLSKTYFIPTELGYYVGRIE